MSSGTHADAAEQLQLWIEDVEAANWKSPHEIKMQFPSASILGNKRICFNVKGNAYRLIVAISYKTGFVLVKFIGTRAEYSKIDADTVEMF